MKRQEATTEAAKTAIDIENIRVLMNLNNKRPQVMAVLQNDLYRESARLDALKKAGHTLQ